jgi:hypothetical protein
MKKPVGEKNGLKPNKLFSFENRSWYQTKFAAHSKFTALSNKQTSQFSAQARNL